MSQIPLVRRAIVGASLAHTSNGNHGNASVAQPQEDQWTPAALERAGSTLKALNRMAKRPPVHILFEDMNLNVHSTKGDSQILHNISGEFRSGELTCILGPSGAGKSSLLNILAGYTSNGVTGRITVNGHTRDMKVFKKLCSYIMQDDLLQPRLSVLESMRIAAGLKLGKELGPAEKELIIEEILQTLGLWDHRETKTEHLSGGQYKRLSIALELVNNPPVIFLDEPTTGLDVVSIRHLVVLLRLLSRQGRTIICTIHQPSASLFSLFDRVYVLARGLCCYQKTKVFNQCVLPVMSYGAETWTLTVGLVHKFKVAQRAMERAMLGISLKDKGAAPLLIPYLTELGHICPTTHNPADFVLETLLGDVEAPAQMSELCQNGKLCRKLDRITARGGRKPVLHSDESIQRIFVEHVAKEQQQKMEFPTSFLTQFFILSKRMFVQNKRNTTGLYIQLLHHVLSAVLIGSIFLMVGNDGRKPIVNFKFCITAVVFFMYTYIMVPVLLFPMEVRLLRREYFNRWYSLKAYYAALTFAGLPVMMILGLVFLGITYLMSGQILELERFLLFSVIGILTGMCSEGLGLLVGSTFSVTNGSIIGPATAAPLLALCCYGMGFGPSIEASMRGLMSASYLRYALSGFSIALYQNRKVMECNDDFCLYADPKLLLRDVGMAGETYWFQILGLLLFTIFHRTMAYYSLRYRLTAEFSSKFMIYMSKILKHK